MALSDSKGADISPEGRKGVEEMTLLGPVSTTSVSAEKLVTLTRSRLTGP